MVKQIVLVVHVDDAYRQWARATLERAGYSVAIATTAAEGLSAARNSVDLIVLAVRLSDMHGFDACRRLKQSRATASIPVIHVAEQYDERDDRASALESGAVAYVAPASNERELIASIGAALRMRQAQRSADALLMRAERMIALGRVAAGVAHEVSSPLAALRVNLDMLLADATLNEDERRVLLEECVEWTARVSEIVGDLRVQRSEPALVALDVDLSVRDALRLFSRAAPPGVVLESSVKPTPHVWANRGRLTQVILNLLINAAHALDKSAEAQPLELRRPGRITLTVDIDAAERVTLMVRDNGAGIPPDKLEGIFDSFFSSAVDAPNSGLGLSICRDIVRAFGGTIEVESTVGVGTTFRVLLPACGTSVAPPPGVAA